MSSKKSKPKVVRVEGAEEDSSASLFQADAASKSRAFTKRMTALLLWLLAIAGEVYGIFIIKDWANNPNMVMLVSLIVLALILAVVGSLLWKSANRLDPASEKEPVRFFIQNQLGVFIAILAFLPLLIFILMSKDMDKQQKTIAGGAAVVALIVASIFGVELNPPSIEQYSEQMAEVEGLTGRNFVYWTKSGTRYHVFNDCHSINSSRTEQINEGTVAQARELKNITQLCGHCRNRAEKVKEQIGIPDADPEPAETPAPPETPAPAETSEVPAETEPEPAGV